MYNSRLVKAEIDLAALAFNVSAIKSLLAPRVKFMAVVKANAYGHGAVAIAKELEKIQVDMLGVACIHEVKELRDAKIKLPILNFGVLFPEDIESIFEFDFIPTVFSLEIAKLISDTAIKKNKIVDIHVKLDTGMNRVGVAFHDTIKLIKDIKNLPNINIAGLYTHFAAAEDLEHSATKIQLKNFHFVLDQLKSENIFISTIHAANSAATMLWPETHFNMVRIGISLYGCKPAPDNKLPIKLKPLLTLKTYISHLKKVPKNTGISYGWTYFTKNEAVIATLPIGYADGFRRTPNNFGHVLVNEKKAEVLGIVCMDQSMIDVTEIANVKVGDEVIIIGKELDFWKIAKTVKTSAYEILCAISARVNRVYINGK